MRKIDDLIYQYGLSHQNNSNKIIHWICVPAILFTILGLITSIPFPFGFTNWIINWGTVIGAFVFVYYWKLSKPISVGFTLIFIVFMYLNFVLTRYCEHLGINHVQLLVVIFILAWLGQFIGHSIEGKRPSFFQDIQFLLIGPAWLLHFIYNKLKINF